MVVHGRTQNKENKGKRAQSRSKSRDPKSKSDIECYFCIKKGHMKRDCPKWKVEKGKEKSSKHDEKKKILVKLEEINVMEPVTEDSDAKGKACGDIYFTSTLDSIFLIVEDGYVISDWIIDSRASLHVSPHREWFTSYVATTDHVRQAWE